MKKERVMEKLLYSFMAMDDAGKTYNVSVYQEYIHGIPGLKNMKTDEGYSVRPRDGKSEQGPYECIHPVYDDLILYRIDEVDASG